MERKTKALISMVSLVLFVVGILIYLQAPTLTRPETLTIIGFMTMITSLITFVYLNLD